MQMQRARISGQVVADAMKMLGQCLQPSHGGRERERERERRKKKERYIKVFLRPKLAHETVGLQQHEYLSNHQN